MSFLSLKKITFDLGKLVLVLFVLSCFSCSHPRFAADTGTKQPRPVIPDPTILPSPSQTTTPSGNPLPIMAVVIPASVIPILPERNGVIKEILIQEGESVYSGKVIATLDHKEIEEQIKKKNLDISLTQLELNRQTLILDTARNDLTNQQTLLKAGLISRNEVDKAILKVSTLQTEIEKTKLSLHFFTEELAQYQKELENSVIKATRAGIILKIYKKAGDLVQKGGTLIDQADPGNLQISFRSPTKLPLGCNLQLLDPTNDTVNGKATVTAVSKAMYAPDNSLEYYARLQNQSPFPIGYSVYVKIDPMLEPAGNE